MKNVMKALAVLTLTAGLAGTAIADTQAAASSSATLPPELVLMQVKVTGADGKVSNTYAYVPKEAKDKLHQGKKIEMTGVWFSNNPYP